MKDLPELIVARDSYQYVNDAFLDSEYYGGYLHSRGVSEESIANHTLYIDESLVPSGVRAVTKPPSNERALSISFSPLRMHRDIEGQGDTLRHEAEHVIDIATKENFSRNRKMMAYLSVYSGAGTGGIATMLATAELTGNLDEATGVPLRGFATIGGGLIGLVLGAATFYKATRLPGGAEYRAIQAQSERADELPDGTLMIDFAA